MVGLFESESGCGILNSISMVAARNKQNEMHRAGLEIWGKGGGLSLPQIAFLSAKKDSNRSRNLCFIMKTIHAVDTQVLKLLRIRFVEHYKPEILSLYKHT